MKSKNPNRTASPTRNAGAECYSDPPCEASLRNRYFEGKRLTTDSFRVEQEYMLERRRLLNRAIHGWGVVYGFGVKAKPDRLEIGAGLALDRCGRELLQSATQIAIEDVIWLNRQGAHVKRDEVEYSPQDRWLLSVHYAEQSIGPVTLTDACQCPRHEWEQTCETVRYSLQPVLPEQCCNAFDCELECECGTGRCCDEPVASDKEITSQKQSYAALSAKDYDDPVTPSNDTKPTKSDSRHQRGGCSCLCKHLTEWETEAEWGSLCEINEPCGRASVDPRNGVPLACVNLRRNECDRWSFENVDACGPRRLVKRNDLLFDLIRGCDLTRISNFGWKSWHRRRTPVLFADFAAAFGEVGKMEPEYITRDFWVEFSRPVRRETLGRDCFVMTVITAERDDGWWETFRVPIVRVEANDTEFVNRATIVVDGFWLRDTMGEGASSLFQGKATRVELEVRGDFILDCNGQAVDANAIGRSKVPTGNGTPGGSFLSTFLVAPAPAPDRPAWYDSENRTKGVS